MLRKVTVLTLILLFGLLATSALAADGAAIYKEKCVMCHAANGSGDTPAGKAMKVKDLRSAEIQKQTDLELTKVVAGGKGKMPAFGQKLSNADIAAVIAYIRTLKAK